MCRPDGSGREISTTIRTHSAECPHNTIATKSAFEGAYHCFSRVGGQVLVTALAIWSELQHASGISTDKRVTEYPKRPRFNTLQVFGRVSPGQYDIRTIVKFFRWLVKSEGQHITR